MVSETKSIRRRGAVNTKYALMSAAIVGGFLLISETAVAQCLPVVYAFRHAEDLNPLTDRHPDYIDDTPPSNGGNPHSLTRIGAMHANLYVEMVRSLEITQKYCPVSTVYAIHPKKPGGTYGTTNPYYTARPLANVVMDDNPIISVEGHRLGSLLEDGEAGPLSNAVQSILESNQSVAIFWDSEGLSSLGNVLSPGSQIPPKPIAPNDPPGPPRNAAYIFEFINGALQPWTPQGRPQYIQCFNWDIVTRGFSTHTYYCGNQNNPNLGGAPDKPPPHGNSADLYRLHGRICDQSMLDPPPSTNYYGTCESAAKPPIWNQFPN
jgi:hypothetical protein